MTWYSEEVCSSSVTWGVTSIEERIVEAVKALKPEPKPIKCDWCGSGCEDKRGNCGACGAPLPPEVV